AMIFSLWSAPSGASDCAQHHFHNPNFKQGHPELLANLKRLTSANKAKMEAGLKVSCRPPAQAHRLITAVPILHFIAPNLECIIEIIPQFHYRSVSKRQPSQRRVKGAPSPYHPSGSQQLKPCDRTPVPPRTWTMGHGNVSSPTHIYTDKGVPLSMIYNMPIDLPYTVQPNSTIVQHGSQNMAVSYHPALMANTYHSFLPFVHQTYTLGYFHPSDHNPDCWSGGSGDSRTSDVNLDTVFKIVDELQSPHKLNSVHVSSPDQCPSTSTAEKSPAGFSQPKTVRASLIASFKKQQLLFSTSRNSFKMLRKLFQVTLPHEDTEIKIPRLCRTVLKD
uniref:Uncharacterized protein n=1 Tax=Astyanax mexicanus TaxID=7994 RepID=A0A3B1J3F0_ASTMX